jgi:hypothetical protein
VKTVLAILLILAAPFAAHAAGDLAGAWKLDRVEGGSGIPIEIDMNVAREGDNLAVEQDIRREGDEPQQVAFTYVTDGEAHVIPATGGETREVTARWKGKRLTVMFNVERSGMTFEVTESWRVRKGELEVRYITPLGDRNLVIKQFFVRP